MFKKIKEKFVAWVDNTYAGRITMNIVALALVCALIYFVLLYIDGFIVELPWLWWLLY